MLIYLLYEKCFLQPVLSFSGMSDCRLRQCLSLTDSYPLKRAMYHPDADSRFPVLLSAKISVLFLLSITTPKICLSFGGIGTPSFSASCRTKSVKETSYRSANASQFNMSGSESPFSHFATACRETPIFSRLPLPGTSGSGSVNSED